MIVLITILFLTYIYLLGNIIKLKYNYNQFVLGFFTIYLIAIIPLTIQYFNLITFNTLKNIIGLEFIASLGLILYGNIKYFNKIKKFKFNKHIIIASLIWIISYLLNTHFSVLTGNGFDDYYYIAKQNHMINDLVHEITSSYHPHQFIEGWIAFNAVIAKLFSIDVLTLNRFVMSIVNIVFSVSVFDMCLSIFTKNKIKFWNAYVPLIIIIFPLISFEYWFGSISRLIYRPFYGSSLSVIALPLLFIWLIEQIRNKMLDVYWLVILLIVSVIMIHAINILFFIFIVSIYILLNIKNKLLAYTMPINILFIIWIGLQLFYPQILIVNKPKSIFEYWNIMYDFTRTAFVLIYLVSLMFFLNKRKRKKLDLIIIIYIPLLILFLFATNLKNVAFNLVYGFGVQRFLSQLLVLICLYCFTNCFNVNNKSIKKTLIIILFVIALINFKQTTIYNGINQQISAYTKNNADLKLTNIKRSTKFIDQIVAKIPAGKIVLTQPWINIDYENKIDRSAYYGYVNSSMCNFNLFSNLSAQYSKGLVYELWNPIEKNYLEHKLKEINPNYIILSEKYRKPNGFICNENLNYLYNKFAQKYIIEQEPSILSSKHLPKNNKMVQYLISKKVKYEIIDLPNYKSKFGLIYLFKLK